MAFAPFTGVNHHGQSILFGGALLENEKEETFVWLFEHFLKYMFSKYPKAIITDQDKAMGNAIKKVFPNARHRFCAWHIKKHELEHLRPYVALFSDFQESYKECLMSDTIEEFETRWEVIRDKYKLENNCWITDMYNQRVHWAKALLKDIFLVVQYDKAIASRRAAEEDEDFKTMNSRPIVTFCLSNKIHVTCSCAKYETCGILCKHSLYVMKKRHVDTLPSHYILPRWTLNARYKVGKRSIRLEEMNNENGVSDYTLCCVRSNFNKVIEQVKDPPSKIENVNNVLIKLLQDQAIRKKPLPVENISQGSYVRMSQVDMTPQLFVRDPLAPTNMKGRPKIASRINSSLEVPKNEDALIVDESLEEKQ
ncbi:protein FAR1-RELATED SEQUENCE 7-like [Lactuca sativa]|uniref:protein FAR1-RELATED SEQUENCE 7-like n=1 Tax=Lactuca sativa TaxID=4236 RepID=UPI000CD8D1EF|nr:protein FAR1-RELATED SEQUENCE 7-like [Lactuca sativa]